ncbi:ABC transporter substrate-binding protein [Halobacteriovorax sp. HLS]|uniref:substrate-binding periplasmic protein n=1 Tax=Halobacteriovorax sp. HLS TaxID=2234000 RepID=UPI000FD70253|nr:transporter substrate-binding domain-containing protein [Halobacteriovorax sp. HLS]
MKFLFTILFISFSFNIHALKIISEIDPPYNYKDKNGKPVGLAVEIVQEIQRRVKNNDPIQFYPWARAYRTAETTPNVVLFSMARTKKRQNLFKWIGPFVDNSWILVTKKNSSLKIDNLEQAKLIPTIGVYRDDSRDHYLTQHGFKNLSRTNLNENGFRMLFADRIDAYAAVDITLDKSLSEIGYKTDELKTLLTLKTVQVFIVISKKTDPSVIKKWKETFESMRNDGTYEKIFRKYFPKRKLPSTELESLD